MVFPLAGSAAPDPADSFSNVDEAVAAGMASDLGPGLLVLTNFPEGAKLAIEFTTLVAANVPAPDAGLAGGCKALPSFVANVVPELTSETCVSCHGGQNPSATGALDLTEVGMNNAAACAQALTKVSLLQDGGASDLIAAPTGGVTSHPYQVSDVATFTTAIQTWIAAEEAAGP